MVERLTLAEYRAAVAQSQGSQPESVVVTQVRQYLRTLGWYVMRIQQGIGCHRGISDLIAVHEGRTVFIECKTKTGRLSAYQQTFRDEILAHGGEYIVVRSLDDVIQWLHQEVAPASVNSGGMVPEKEATL